MRFRQKSIFAAIALAATVIFAASSPSPQVMTEVATVQAEVKAERPMPIRFEYKPGSALEKSLAAHVESANAKLGIFLVDLRAGKKKDGELLKAARSEFAGTYLRNPVLRKDDRTTVKGWEAIIPELRRILDDMIYVSVHNVHAILEYLPADPKAERGFDFRAVVKTRLACAPTECTWLEGGACHRLSCTWEPCDWEP